MDIPKKQFDQIIEKELEKMLSEAGDKRMTRTRMEEHIINIIQKELNALLFEESAADIVNIARIKRDINNPIKNMLNKLQPEVEAEKRKKAHKKRFPKGELIKIPKVKVPFQDQVEAPKAVAEAQEQLQRIVQEELYKLLDEKTTKKKPKVHMHKSAQPKSVDSTAKSTEGKADDWEDTGDPPKDTPMPTNIPSGAEPQDISGAPASLAAPPGPPGEASETAATPKTKTQRKRTAKRRGKGTHKRTRQTKKATEKKAAPKKAAEKKVAKKKSKSAQRGKRITRGPRKGQLTSPEIRAATQRRLKDRSGAEGMPKGRPRSQIKQGKENLKEHVMAIILEELEALCRN